jgi:hypothetical protein
VASAVSLMTPCDVPAEDLGRVQIISAYDDGLLPGGLSARSAPTARSAATMRTGLPGSLGRADDQGNGDVGDNNRRQMSTSSNSADTSQ